MVEEEVKNRHNIMNWITKLWLQCSFVYRMFASFWCYRFFSSIFYLIHFYLCQLYCLRCNCKAQLINDWLTDWLTKSLIDDCGLYHSSRCCSNRAAYDDDVRGSRSTFGSVAYASVTDGVWRPPSCYALTDCSQTRLTTQQPMILLTT